MMGPNAFPDPHKSPHSIFISPTNSTILRFDYVQSQNLSNIPDSIVMRSGGTNVQSLQENEFSNLTSSFFLPLNLDSETWKYESPWSIIAIANWRSNLWIRPNSQKLCWDPNIVGFSLDTTSVVGFSLDTPCIVGVIRMQLNFCGIFLNVYIYIMMREVLECPGPQTSFSVTFRQIEFYPILNNSG